MTEEKGYFVSLLSSYVNKTAPKGEKTDFAELFRLAQINDVGAIIANELKSVSGEFQPEGQYKSYFNQVLGYAVLDDEARSAAYALAGEFLNRNKSRHLFVKGINVRNYYPDPPLRTSGDIDAIAGKDDLETLFHSAKKENIRVAGFVSNTLTLSFNNVDVEIHSGADVFGNYFDDIFSLCSKKGEYLYKLGEYDELLYVLCHLAKHLAYRGAGIRMLLDVDLMIRGIEGFDENYFFSLCEKAGILKIARIILSFCKRLFNTPVSELENIDGALLERLENAFIDGGSFGYETNSVAFRYMNDGGSRLKTVLKMAFPSREYLKICYPYYKNHPFLLPAARVNRLLDGAFKKRRQAENALSQLKEKGASSAQLELLKELGIDKY